MIGTEAYRLWAAELSDEAAPRVHPDKPNLYVGVTIEDPDLRFAYLRHGWRSKHPVAQYGVKLRRDLSEQLPAYADKAAATQAEKELIKGLRRQGFVVNGVGYRYRVYVILLKDEVGPRKCPDKPWIYVGQTRKDVNARFREHREGARNRKGRLYSSVVYRYGIRLMPELYESIPFAYAPEDIQREERILGGGKLPGSSRRKGGH